ncbi:uncharacterized protein LOC119161581 [Rhipicephalus microplus]
MAQGEEVGACFLWTAYDPCVQDAVVEFVKSEAGPNRQVHILRTESPSDDLKTSTLFGYIVNSIRKRELFPNWRTTVLAIPEHFKALHLCTARVNQRSGKFYALASEVMYADFLYKEHLARPDEPVKSEFVQEYLDFLSHTNTSNEWQVLKVFRRAIEEDSMFAAQVAKSVYLVHGPITTHFTKECIELLFKGRQPRRIVTEAPLDISVNEDYDISNVSVRADFSVVPEPDASTVEKSDSDSVEYSLRIMNAFLRILVNSCDELALATAMASPVFKLPHDAFKELKRLSLQKNSPMCKTVVSYVKQARLGSDSLAAPEYCALKPYICKLAAFVDVLLKLQNVVERGLTMVAIEVVICTIGRCIRSACGHGPIWKTVLHCQANLVLLARRFHEEEDTENLDDANDATLGTADSANTLRILRRLTDFLSTRHTFFRPLSVMDNRDANSTPLRIPHLLEYFKTPEPESEDDGYDVPLKQRLLEQFEREGATHLIAALHAMTDSGHKKKKRKSSIRKLPDKDTSFVSAQKEEPSVVQKKATRKGSSLQTKPSAARKVAKRSILDDINSASKKQRLSSKLVCEDQAKITSFFTKT